MEEAIDVEIATRLEENGHVGFACGQLELSRSSVLGVIECHPAIASRSVLRPEMGLLRECRVVGVWYICCYFSAVK